MNSNNTSTLEFGCKLCRKLNDGLCNNYCSFDKAGRKKLMQANEHLFRVELSNKKEGAQ